MVIGVLGEYLGRVYDEVKGRPLYLVAEEVGGSADAPPPRPPREVGGSDTADADDTGARPHP
jgi:hypothetical protein